VTGGLLWWILRAHWAAGLVLLLPLPEASRPALIAAALAFAAGTALDRAGVSRASWRRFANPLVLVAAFPAAADLLYGRRDLLAAASLLLLGVQSVRLLLPKRARDGWQLCALSFLGFLAVAASTTAARFAALLFLYTGLSAGALWALQIEGDAEREGRTARPGISPLFAARMLALSTVAGTLVTALLFALIPRIGVGRIAPHLGRPAGLSGFSDGISLRDVTAVKTDRRVIARVEFPLLGRSLSPTTLHLRGFTYSRFDGARWTRLGAPRRSVPKTGLVYPGAPHPQGANLSIADIALEPTDHDALFVYGSPVTIEGRLGTLLLDDEGNYAFARPSHSAVRYRLLFSPEVLPSAPATATLQPDQYLALPPGSERIRALAHRVAPAGLPPTERAERFLRFLRSGFRYTLTDPAASVEDFLFVRRAGHCEHYATALCLLLRAAGIPARIAAGYMGGEWSAIGRYLIVRQSDAHAWTEAWLSGRWVTLDGTPPEEGSSSPVRTGFAGIVLDWVVQQWGKHVVNYSLETQVGAVAAGRRALERAPARLSRLAAPGGDLRRLAPLLLPAILAVAIVLAVRRRSGPLFGGRTGPGRKTAAMRLPRSYTRLLRALERAGHRKAAGTTLDAMVRTAADGRADLAPCVGRFLALYHRDRFGVPELTREERREADRLADRLRRGVSRPVAS
jgi:protein-glutamine gamma-glutamyltransferase